MMRALAGAGLFDDGRYELIVGLHGVPRMIRQQIQLSAGMAGFNRDGAWVLRFVTGMSGCSAGKLRLSALLVPVAGKYMFRLFRSIFKPCVSNDERRTTRVREEGAVLHSDDALTHRGSLLSPDGRIIAPYDLEQEERDMDGCAALASHAGILNAAVRPFELAYAKVSTVHVITGMGVTLCDSIIGLTALHAIRRAHPQVRFVLYRPARAPRHFGDLAPPPDVFS